MSLFTSLNGQSSILAENSQKTVLISFPQAKLSYPSSTLSWVSVAGFQIHFNMLLKDAGMRLENQLALSACSN